MSKFQARYFSTFITGAEKIIENKLKKQPNRIRIISLCNGLVIYESNYSLSDIQGFKFFNNSFFLLEKFDLSLDGNPVQYVLKHLICSKAIDIRGIRGYLSKNKVKTFKINISLKNQIVPLIKPLIEKLEDKIMKLTGLRMNLKYPDMEFWISIRSEKFALFGIKLPKKMMHLEKGQLRLELAHILNYLSQPSQKDTFLDPFSGNGSIPLEIIRSFPFNKIIAIDKDSKLLNNLKREIRPSEKIVIKTGDALNLEIIKDSTIDKIITDPPWGFYEKTDMPIEEFYLKMLGEFYRIVRPNGVIVILMGDKSSFKDALERMHNKFVLLEEYNILVSGKKASIYKMRKI